MGSKVSLTTLKHPYQTRGKDVILYILTFILQTAKGKVKDSGPNSNRKYP